MAKSITRTEALKRARERAAANLARENKLIGLMADWEVASTNLDNVYLAFYSEDLTRSQIAARLGVPVGRVPKPEDLATTDSDVATDGLVTDDATDAETASDGQDVRGDDVGADEDEGADRGSEE